MSSWHSLAKQFPDALLWHFRLDGRGGLAPAATLNDANHDVPEGVTGTDNDIPSGIEWVHIQSDAKGADSIMQSLGLAPDIVDSLTANETRPRTVITDAGTMVYLRGINRNPNADPDDMVSLRLWLTPTLVVTARKKHRKLMSVQDVRQRLENGQGPRNVGELVCAIVEKIADRINETVDEIDDALVQLEERIHDDATRVSRIELASVRRQSASIRRYLAPQREALEGLNRDKSLITNAQTFELREQSDRMTRYVEDLDLARERAVVLQEEVRNQIAEMQGQRMYVLSLVTAIFLPLSFLTGVFGMNVAGLPGLEEPSAFVLLASGMVVIALVSLILMKWQKWM